MIPACPARLASPWARAPAHRLLRTLLDLFDHQRKPCQVATGVDHLHAHDDVRAAGGGELHVGGRAEPAIAQLYDPWVRASGAAPGAFFLAAIARLSLTRSRALGFSGFRNDMVLPGHANTPANISAVVFCAGLAIYLIRGPSF